VIAEVPEIAIARVPKPKVTGTGAEARSVAAAQSGEVFNPFGHSRSLVSDFTLAEQLLRHQLRKILGNRLINFGPYVVIHPLGSPAGGFTQVELRAFREMAIGAGASEVHVWTGRPLTDQEVLSRKAPASGGEWE
jgi:rod shape-determining protein MreB